MKTIRFLALSIFCFLLISSVALAGDIESGKLKVASCAACHGKAGVSSNPEWPNLAGQQKVYLKNQIIAFREGHRANAMMTPMVKDLTDGDAEDIAAYYSSLNQ